MGGFSCGQGLGRKGGKKKTTRNGRLTHFRGPTTHRLSSRKSSETVPGNVRTATPHWVIIMVRLRICLLRVAVRWRARAELWVFQCSMSEGFRAAITLLYTTRPPQHYGPSSHDLSHTHTPQGKRCSPCRAQCAQAGPRSPQSPLPTSTPPAALPSHTPTHSAGMEYPRAGKQGPASRSSCTSCRWVNTQGGKSVDTPRLAALSVPAAWARCRHRAASGDSPGGVWRGRREGGGVWGRNERRGEQRAHIQDAHALAGCTHHTATSR